MPASLCLNKGVFLSFLNVKYTVSPRMRSVWRLHAWYSKECATSSALLKDESDFYCGVIMILGIPGSSWHQYKKVSLYPKNATQHFFKWMTVMHFWSSIPTTHILLCILESRSAHCGRLLDFPPSCKSNGGKPSHDYRPDNADSLLNTVHHRRNLC